jgi:hypothetical protein
MMAGWRLHWGLSHDKGNRERRKKGVDMQRKSKPFVFDTNLGMEGIIAEIRQPENSKMFAPKRVKAVEASPALMGTGDHTRDRVLQWPQDALGMTGSLRQGSSAPLKQKSNA